MNNKEKALGGLAYNKVVINRGRGGGYTMYIFKTDRRNMFEGKHAIMEA